MYKRIIFNQGLPKASLFVFGPRQTGKTTFFKEIESSISYNLLDSGQFLRINRDPEIIYKECKSLDSSKQHYVWIDEVQKIPQLLDVIHRIIEEIKNINFILSGSSARKLKQQGVNLLGGRALDYKFHPLTIPELGKDFNLDIALKFGTLPKIYDLITDGQLELAKEYLSSYVSIYLEEEIRQEAIVRNLQPFQRFLEVAAQSTGNLINFSKISDDCQISHNATKNYFSILEDTLIGFFIPSYHVSIRKQLVKQPKFYFFDNGVNRAILNTLNANLSGLEKGVMFEQYVIQEIKRLNDYYRTNYKFYFWKTESGAEVDLLICRGKDILYAIEFKSSAVVNKRDLSGLKSFNQEYPKVKKFICAPVERDFVIEQGYDVVTVASLVNLIAK